MFLLICSQFFLNCTQHGFIDWHDAPTTPSVRGLLGDLQDRVWKRESYAAKVECTDEPKEEKEQKAVVLLTKLLEKRCYFVCHCHLSFWYNCRNDAWLVFS